jgi:thiosulfate dehydrogenase
VLPEQDAWDVAAFIQSQPRPQKANLDRDYPVKLEKPVDNGYGPYADGFTQDQHRYGPFADIRERIKQLLAATAQVKPAATP